MTRKDGGKTPVGRFIIKAYSASEMADFYQVHLRTFLKWLEPHQEAIGEKVGRFFNIRQVLIIIDKLGEPGDQVILLILMPLAETAEHINALGIQLPGMRAVA